MFYETQWGILNKFLRHAMPSRKRRNDIFRVLFSFHTSKIRWKVQKNEKKKRLETYRVTRPCRMNDSPPSRGNDDDDNQSKRILYFIFIPVFFVPYFDQPTETSSRLDCSITPNNIKKINASRETMDGAREHCARTHINTKLLIYFLLRSFCFISSNESDLCARLQSGISFSDRFSKDLLIKKKKYIYTYAHFFPKYSQ